jgi:uncharacterized protein
MEVVKWLLCPWTRVHSFKIRMKVQTWLITGATGLVGTALVRHLLFKGHQVRTLGRSAQGTPGVAHFAWSPSQGNLPPESLQGVDVVVHLAGASVGRRWTASHRRAILESRVQGTSLLRKALAEVGFEGVWIQASAVGFYGSAPNPVDENAPRGAGFLSDVVEAWEDSACSDPEPQCRRVVMRLGLILAPTGGTLAQLLPIYKWGLGAPLGSGRQRMSWIHLQDVIRFVAWAASTPDAHGTFNVVAPFAPTNGEFSRTLARVLRRPHWAPRVPGWALHLAMGEMASLLLEGQNTLPNRLLDAGFTWLHPDLESALQDCVQSST